MYNFVNKMTSVVNKHTSNDTGYLELIIGPMFSGKTTSIIELNKIYSLSKLKTCIINYAEDKRYDDSMICTHDKIKNECINLLELDDIFDNEEFNSYDVFLINEGQFFPDLYNCVRDLVEIHKKIVYVCGLDGDYKRNGFEQMLSLIPLADNVTKKYSICMSCQNGTKAIFSHRITNETELKVIGSDNYIPLCRKCYLDKTNTSLEIPFV